MVIRDSVIARVIFAFTAATFLVFAVVCAFLGNKVSSTQWVYLMSTPGHNWFWATVFGVSSIAAGAGVYRRWYLIAAIGLFSIATFDMLIAAFFLLSPLVDAHLMTLGYVIWIFGAVLIYAFAAANLTAVKWF